MCLISNGTFKHKNNLNYINYLFNTYISKQKIKHISYRDVFHTLMFYLNYVLLLLIYDIGKVHFTYLNYYK